MDKFTKAVKNVLKKCDELLKTKSYTLRSLPKKIPSAGVYVFSKNDRVLYVGRTNNLRQRLQFHTRNNHNQATFAFLLARHRTKRTEASYQTTGSRNDLLRQPDFRAAFDKARMEILAMDVQFIEEKDSNRQALLEICTAMRARAKYSNFDNH